MRIIFFGSGTFAVPVLDFLIKNRREELLAVITQPDRKAGRKLAITFTPVKNYLRENYPEMKIFQPEDVNQNDFIKKINDLNPDLFIVISFGQIFSSKLLNIPSKFALNIHASLLPKYRGAAPINWAIINGEKLTGISIFKMNEKMDAGEIIIQDSCKIQPEDNAITLEKKLSQISLKLLKEVFKMLENNSIKFQPQKGEISFAPKLKKNDGLINWREPAVSIRNKIRGFQPWPGAFTYWNGKLLKIYSAELSNSESGNPGEIIAINKEYIKVKCGEDALELLEIQLEGAKRIMVKEFLLGHNFKVGEILKA